MATDLPDLPDFIDEDDELLGGGGGGGESGGGESGVEGGEMASGGASGGGEAFHVGTHVVSFQDLGLKKALLDAITDNGFEHPSSVQQEALPPALLGSDLLCQAKSGMGMSLWGGGTRVPILPVRCL